MYNKKGKNKSPANCFKQGGSQTPLSRVILDHFLTKIEKSKNIFFFCEDLFLIDHFDLGPLWMRVMQMSTNIHQMLRRTQPID